MRGSPSLSKPPRPSGPRRGEGAWSRDLRHDRHVADRKAMGDQLRVRVNLGIGRRRRAANVELNLQPTQVAGTELARDDQLEGPPLVRLRPLALLELRPVGDELEVLERVGLDDGNRNAHEVLALRL